jgi:outer membrane immunogenic protein
MQMGEYSVNNLKSTLLSAVFLAGMGTLMTANAADVYSRGSIKDSGPVDYRPAISWTGFYIGAHAGGAFGDEADIDIPRVASVPFNAEIDSTWLAGVHVGYNWQSSGNLVLGIEGSWSVLAGERNVDLSLGGFDVGTVEKDDNWLASIRGRLGFAAGSTLIYGTGGVAFLNGSNNGLVFEDSNALDDSLTGWVAGVGVEHKLRDNLSLGLEGLYYSFDDETEFDGLDVDLERDFWTVQARITYHFGDRHAGEPLK